jgi:methylated-DNA-[protein]-cysteine S-methyltransferase
MTGSTVPGGPVPTDRDGDDAVPIDLAGPFVRSDPRGGFAVAAIEGPWGPIHVAVSREAVVGLAVLSPREPFVDDVAHRTGLEWMGRTTPALLDRAVVAVEAFLDGDPSGLRALPLDLADRGPWDRNVLGGVRTLAWGEVTSYGRLARMIGRRGAARAVGGAVGRNPIGLAIPCHRVIAGDGTIGGYGGDWFGSPDELLAIKRELLAREGVSLPARSMRD